MKKPLFVASVVVLFCAACNFIIEGDFSGYKSGNPYLNATTCGLTALDAGTTCSACIEKECASELKTACNSEDGGREPWFSNELQACASRPEANPSGTSWGCANFLNDAAVAIPNATESAEKKNNAIVCVRDKCLRGKGASDCRQCTVEIEAEGTKYPLSGSECGKCILDTCKDVVTQDCISAGSLAPCGVKNLPSPYDTQCARVFELDGGMATAQIRSCIQPCADKCKK